METRRRYIRHPTDIPIEYHFEQIFTDSTEPLRDISEAGLSFRSSNPVASGVQIEVKIPFVRPPFAATGSVVWCKQMGHHYDVGVKFGDGESRFRLRMVEQICQIEHYRMKIRRQEHRELSGEEAAREWINRYASRFPSLAD